MKKLISFLIVICATIAFIIPSNGFAKDDGAFGLHFGDSLDKMQKEYTLEHKKESKWEIKNFANANEYFEKYLVGFSNNKLSEICAFSKRYEDGDILSKDYIDIIKTLEEKYGKPQVKKEDDFTIAWFNVNEYIKSIALFINANAESGSFSIIYVSKKSHMVDEVEKEKQKDKERRKKLEDSL